MHERRASQAASGRRASLPFREAGICFLSALLWGVGPAPFGREQSRPAERQPLGVMVTLAAYSVPGRAAAPHPEPVRLTQTFDSPEAEQTYLRKMLGYENASLVHVRSVGLLRGERFRDGIFVADRRDDLAAGLLEREIMLAHLSRTTASVSFTLWYRNRPILRASDVEMHNFETILFEAGIASSDANSPESASEGEPHSLVTTITIAIVPATQLRERPHEISAPCDEYGRRIALRPEDVFSPPILIERVSPKLPTRRALGTILIEGIVTPEGRVINARVVRTFDREMDAFAIEAFQRFRFLPARLNGEPIRATVREEVVFQTVP